MVTGVGSPSIKSDIVAAGHQLARFEPKAGPTTVPPITNATVAPMAVWMTANARARNRRRCMSSGHIAEQFYKLFHNSIVAARASGSERATRTERAGEAARESAC